MVSYLLYTSWLIITAPVLNVQLLDGSWSCFQMAGFSSAPHIIFTYSLIHFPCTRSASQPLDTGGRWKGMLCRGNDVCKGMEARDIWWVPGKVSCSVVSALEGLEEDEWWEMKPGGRIGTSLWKDSLHVKGYGSCGHHHVKLVMLERIHINSKIRLLNLHSLRSRPPSWRGKAKGPLPYTDWGLASCQGWGSYLPCCFPQSTPGRSAGIWGLRCERTSNASRSSNGLRALSTARYSNRGEIRAE